MGVALLALPSAAAPIPASSEFGKFIGGKPPGHGPGPIVNHLNPQFPGSAAAPIPPPLEHSTIHSVNFEPKRRQRNLLLRSEGHQDGVSHETLRTAAQATQEQVEQEGQSNSQFPHYKPLSASKKVPEIFPGAVTANSKVARHHKEAPKGPAKLGKSASAPVAPANGHGLLPGSTVPGAFATRPGVVEGTVRMPANANEPHPIINDRSLEEEKAPSRSDKLIGGLNKVNDAGNAVAGIVQTGEGLWDAGKEVYDHFKNKNASKGQNSKANES